MICTRACAWNPFYWVKVVFTQVVVSRSERCSHCFPSFANIWRGKFPSGCTLRPAHTFATSLPYCSSCQKTTKSLLRFIRKPQLHWERAKPLPRCNKNKTKVQDLPCDWHGLQKWTSSFCSHETGRFLYNAMNRHRKYGVQSSAKANLGIL